MRTATPLFASQIGHKYAQLKVRAAQADLEQRNGRTSGASYIQGVADGEGSIAAGKGEDWEHELRVLERPITTVGVSLDGAMIPMADSGGYGEPMVRA